MSKITTEWKLPKPIDNGDHYEWKPVVRVGKIVPFGYGEDPSDKDILLPITKELELLEQAKKHLKRYSYRAVAAWLSEQSGRVISHVGLYKRGKLEHKRKKDFAQAALEAEKVNLEAIKEANRHAEAEDELTMGLTKERMQQGKDLTLAAVKSLADGEKHHATIESNEKIASMKPKPTTKSK